MKTKLQFALALFLTSVGYAQQVYKIPFVSSGNTIEMAVENGSTQMVSGVKVSVKDIPSWVHMVQIEQKLDQLKPNKERNAVFTFSVDKAAPVNKEEHLTFIITTPSGEAWTKDIGISVLPPDRFELLQNYPNPFNPQTKIEYILPITEQVKLIVYDILGREVQRLVDGMQNAGYQSVLFDAGNLPSGVYFYRLQANTSVDVRRM